MSNIDKQALREVAERATPGNWRRTSSLFNGITVTPFSLCGEEVTLAHTVEKRDAEFIAAANPRTMLALLDELEVTKQERENWRISFDNERYRADKLAAAFNTEHEQLLMANGALITQHMRANTAEKRIAELERANAAQDDHINQQQDRIDELEKGHQEAACSLVEENEELKRKLEAAGKQLVELPRAASVNSQWKPDVCPVTGRKFFMWIEHETLGYVPTYGGPFDSYTIPIRDSNGEFSCERYDHDFGGWVGGEFIGLHLIDDEEQCRVCELEERIAELEAKLETADRLQDGAFRDGLKAGFSYGQTDDQSGFTQCMSAYSNAGIQVKGE
ncbi:TPA: ead/Ea22-like family protein [Salmonella enterica subsp. enterica serovar Bahrenfeld]